MAEPEKTAPARSGATQAPPAAPAPTASAAPDAETEKANADREARLARLERATSAACPHCGSKLIEHEGDDNPHKIGAKHCNACGCCFIDGEVRPGTMACTLAVPVAAANR